MAAMTILGGNARRWLTERVKATVVVGAGDDGGKGDTGESRALIG